MLTINETPKQNNKKNLKLMLSALASTALIGASVSYLTSNGKNNNTNNGSKFLEMFPEEFTADVQFKSQTENTNNNLIAFGTFNKFNDENNEWEVEGKLQTIDFTNNSGLSYYMKDERMYVAEGNVTIDCVTNERLIGYAQLKYAILNGVEVTDELIDEKVMKEVKVACPELSSKIVIESGDFGTLLICAKKEGQFLKGGVFGKEWEAKFQIHNKKAEITVPFDNPRRGFHIMENEEKLCYKNNKFETTSEYDEKHLESMKVGKNYKFENYEMFPFRNDRKLPTADEMMDVDIVFQGGRDEHDEIDEIDDPQVITNGVPPPPAPPKHYCQWMHGNGNHKGFRHTPYKHKDKKFHDYVRSEPDGTPFANESIIITPQTPLADIKENSPDHYYRRNGVTQKQNGSAPFHSFVKGKQYNEWRDAWYPYFIRGSVSVEGKDPNGIFHKQCRQGKFWYANSSKNSRIYYKNEVMREVGEFMCGENEGCEVGHFDHEFGVIHFSHSYGGLITMNALWRGEFYKGPKMIWGASQSPFMGSAGGNFVEELCDEDSPRDGAMGYPNRLWDLLPRSLFFSLYFTFRMMNYCENDNSGAKYAHGLLIGSFEFQKPPANHSIEWFQDDFTVDYKYCGTHPGGIVHNLFTDDPTFNLHQLIPFGVNLGSFIARAIARAILNPTLNIVYEVWYAIDRLQNGVDFNDYLNGHYGRLRPITGSNVMAGEGWHNDIKLYILSYYTCRYWNHCDEVACKSSPQDSCTFRGCSTGALCRTNWNSGWAAQRFNFKGDGMVPLSSCLGDSSSNYFRIDTNYAIGNPLNINRNTPGYSLMVANGTLSDHFTNVHISSGGITEAYKGGQKQDDFNDAGKSRNTIQQANHEDGTGVSGNSVYVNRAPINWFSQVVHEATGVWNNGGNSNANPVDINSRLSQTTLSNNFWKGSANTLDDEHRQENVVIIDYDQSNGQP